MPYTGGNRQIEEWLGRMDPGRRRWMEDFFNNMGWNDPRRPINQETDDPLGKFNDPYTPPEGNPPPPANNEDAPPPPAPPPPAAPDAPPAPPPTAPKSIYDYAGGGVGGGGGFRMDSGGGGGGGMQQGGEIVNRLMANRGALGELDTATQAQLAKVKEAELMALQKTMGEQSASLLENMFGRGVQRSTIAGRVGEQLVASQGLAAAQVESGAAQREIALRQDISNRAVEELAVASKELDSQRGFQVGMAGVAAENNRTSAMLSIAAMETKAKMAIAQGQLDLGYAGLENEKYMFDENLGLEKEKFGWTKESFFEDLKRKDRQLDIMQEEVKGNKRNSWLSFFGALGGGLLEAIPFMSHPACKEYLDPVTPEEAMEILEQIKNLPMYKFKYIDGEEEHIGVNAIEAKQVNDKLSNGVNLKPMDIIFSLMAAVKALNTRVEELENA